MWHAHTCVQVEKLSQALSERDRQLSTAKKEAKALKAEQANWGKTQKSLEAQVGTRHARHLAYGDAMASLTHMFTYI